jgi:hypothetical protein
MAQDHRELSIEECQLQRDLKLRVLGVAAIEHSRRRQASRLVWLKEGDACTKIFHLKANDRRRKHFIPCLKDEHGELKWSQGDKEQVLFNHFQKILGTKETRQAELNWDDINLTRLPDDHYLDDPVTEQEVKRAIDELPSEKASGPDGFTGVFYRVCWEVIKSHVLAAIQCVYSLTVGALPKLNGALLTLLPKKEVDEVSATTGQLASFTHLQN